MKTIHTLETLMARCDEEGDCLIWRGYIRNRCPMVSHAGKMTTVRRLFTQLLGGEVKEGGFYSAKCGHHDCVKPEHTVWRPQHQHAAYMNQCLVSNQTLQELRARKISASKRQVTDEQIAHMMQSTASNREVAKELGLAYSTISKYRRFRSASARANNPFAGLMR